MNSFVMRAPIKDSSRSLKGPPHPFSGTTGKNRDVLFVVCVADEGIQRTVDAWKTPKDRFLAWSCSMSRDPDGLQKSLSSIAPRQSEIRLLAHSRTNRKGYLINIHSL